MKEFLESIATANGWNFMYAREDYHNLYDGLDSNDVVMLLRPLQSSSSFNERGAESSITWSGSFTLSMSSDFDEQDYEYRYNNYIKPITATAYQNFKQAFACNETYTLNSLSTVEVINSQDFNLDGLFVSFSITEDLQ